MRFTEILMAFAPVPTESKRAINRAAQEIINNKLTVETFELVNKWRACHAYPINTFQSTLRQKLRNAKYSPDSIVAQRLKRFVTIIGKLIDDKRLTLTTMQDIGGVRAIVKSLEEVYELRQEYLSSKHFAAMIEHGSCKDYIEKPKESGYRSVHLIFKYQNQLNNAYDGLRIEMQIRTKLQHLWATAVEVMGTFRGEKLKSGQGDEKWQQFFAYVSSYFAYREKCQPVFPDLTEKETCLEIRKLELELGAIEMMSGFTVAAKEIHQKIGRKSSYYLIVLDSKKQTVNITAYDRDSIEKAFGDYSKIELTNAEEKKEIEAVLVSAGKVGDLKKAYPNFFLDTREFVKELIIIKNKILY